MRARPHTADDVAYAFPVNARDEPILPPHRSTGGLALLRRTSVAFESRARFRQTLKTLCPLKPGIYVMLDRNQQALYVGKSKRLRTRLLSHLRVRSFSDKGARILAHTHTVLWEELPDEFGCLLREVELIELLRPRFNVRDNPNRKRLGYLCLGRAPASTLFLARHRTRETTHSVGPVFLSKKLARGVALLNDLLQLRDCPDRSQPMYFPEQELSYPTTPACHRYSFRQCLGPCAGRVTLTDYQSAAAQAERIVAGESTTLVSALERRLEALIEALAFEEASLLYEEIQTVQWTVSLIARCHERRRKLTFVYPAQGEGEALHWYIIRQGKVLRVAKAPTTGEEAKALRTFLRQIAKGEGTLPLAASENTSLVVSWFRLHPELRNDTLSLREAIRQCTAVIGPVARRGARQT